MGLTRRTRRNLRRNEDLNGFAAEENDRLRGQKNQIVVAASAFFSLDYYI